jgi:penicillin amidase
LDYFNLLGGIPTLDSDLSYTTSTPLPCADGNTIWSQRGQSYTQWVNLNEVDTSKSVLPPGNFEGPGGAWQAEVLLWESGELKNAPLSLDAVKEHALMAITLSYPTDESAVPSDR